jgi:hypothetical protein
MSSYKVKVTDSANKLLVIDVELPFFGGLQNVDNPDSNWTTETSGLIAPEMGRCSVRRASSDSSASSDGSTPAPASGDPAIPAGLAFGSAYLYLCTPVAPYVYGIALNDFLERFPPMAPARANCIPRSRLPAVWPRARSPGCRFRAERWALAVNHRRLMRKSRALRCGSSTRCNTCEPLYRWNLKSSEGGRRI